MNPARRWSPARRPASETSTDLPSGKGGVLGEDGTMFIRLGECEPRGPNNSTTRNRPSTHACYRVLHRSFFRRPVREPRLMREALPFFSRDHHRAHIPSVPVLRDRSECGHSVRTLVSGLVRSCPDARTTSHVLTGLGSQPLRRSDCRYRGRSMLWTSPRQASLLRGTHSLLLRRRIVSSQRLTFLNHSTMVMSMVMRVN